MELDRGDFYLGTTVEHGKSAGGEPLIYDSSDLTTHGVIVGMTGSGKTGLGIDLLEEAMLNDIPCLVLDPKGDMGNLLLGFPDFAPEDFEPWVDPSEAKKEGVTTLELASRKADLWRNGLESAGIGPDRLRKLNEGSEITVYTPGSAAGVGLNVLGSLKAPDLDWDTEAEMIRDEIEGLVSSLLLLADIEADPVSDPRHILVSAIIEKSWSSGEDLDLAGLVGQIPRPPFRKLGVFELDTFFPEKDRMALAMKLNGLLASPSFASWLEGEPLDIVSMLEGGDRTKTAVIYLAHLSEQERQFMVTLVLSRMITWFRGKSGTSDLRSLIYMDEVFGYVPPVAEPPTKKAILTILKQARAFGVGMVLSTQNPVDIDYKALSNAGTWMIGRLQTERDKERLLDGLDSASGEVDISAVGDLISELDNRQFVLNTTGDGGPVVFGTRWAQSYLAGPLTREQVSTLMKGRAPTQETPEPEETSQPSTPAEDRATPAEDEDVVPVAPPVHEKAVVSFADPAASWLEAVGGSPTSTRYRIGAASTVQLKYDERVAGLDHTETYEAIIHPVRATMTEENVSSVDHDERDFLGGAPNDATFEIPEADVGSASFWTQIENDLEAYLVSNRPIEILKNEGLKLYSRPGETTEEFETRCRAVAEENADAELAKLKDRYATKIDRVKDQISKAETRVTELSSQADAKKQEEMVTGVGDLIGGLLGGRKASTALGKAARRRTATRTAESRVDTALDSLDDKTADLADLEVELEDEVIEITGRWEDAVTEVEAIEVSLETTDVKVTSLRAVWIPV